MTDIRRRKVGSQQNGTTTKTNSKGVTSTSPQSDGSKSLVAIEVVLGLTIAFFIGYKYALYAKELHENDMWFSNIGQVEREISFRTESGLYFSYYKQMVFAPSISQGIFELTHDNVTEHLRTINILERFNIYQEVILAVIYRVFDLQKSIEYVYFYINTIFGLHGMYMVAVFVSSWILSGSFLAGLLATGFYIFNKPDTTRISYTIPLRESFGFPFLFAQIAAITYYFKKDISKLSQYVCVSSILCCTVLFTLVWQFAQFILLLECMAFFGVYSLGFLPKYKIRNLYLIVIFSIVSVCLLMFVNDMMLCSLALSFSLAGLILLAFQAEGPSNAHFFIKLLKLLFHVVTILTMTVAISTLIKVLLKVESDEHIFKFLKAKLGLNIGRDFDSLLYLCEGAFQMLPTDTYSRLTDGIVFPCYIISLTVGLVMLTYTVVMNWSNSKTEKITDKKDDDAKHAPPLPSLPLNEQPELVYHTIQTVMFAVMAVSTLRFKFLWTPNMCIYAAGVFCHQGFWRYLLSKINVKSAISNVLSHAVPALVFAILLSQKLTEAIEELKELKEFHDPDTVELMNWIRSHTHSDSAFTGSMQLMAGVKLCTGRPITNHPHYENKFLRERTKEVYQVYARRTPKDVHTIMKKHGANYVILENSICYSRQAQGCKLKDILDLDNGHVIEGGDPEPGLIYSQVSRFCEAIKYDQKNFSRYFRKVFENRTFYLYKIL